MASISVSPEGGTPVGRQHLAREVHLGIKIGNKLLEFAYLYRFSLLSEHTAALTLFLVRANTAADGRQVALGIDDAHRRTHVTM